MLDRFPSLLSEWIKKQKVEVEQLAREYAEGDYEVYRDTYNSEISRVDPCYDEELLFNQAMLIMVYSYYESFLCRLAKECGLDVKTDARPSSIANEHNGTIFIQERKIMRGLLLNWKEKATFLWVMTAFLLLIGILSSIY